MTKEQDTPLLLFQQYDELESVNKQLAKELEQQKQLTAQLQMSLLAKHAEIDRLTVIQERFVREFVHNKAKLWNRGDKVETVRFVAEVTTVIDMVKGNKPTGSRKDSLLRAEQYLAGSKTALDKGDFEDALSLAEQALQQVQAMRLQLASDGQLKDDILVNFAAPLPMRLLKSSNLRDAPSIEAKVKGVLETGCHVIAVGYKGQWVQVMTEEQDKGWVHFSLLSGV
ncbi:MAG: SH3 domain-containing protein [Proteobacteria bacterium]|nr:SH3 domain-containing protein [Pseudomonadota bacterium]MBU1456669.1 SH3 domain-containing protein [Pseudomonadota bacterium]